MPRISVAQAGSLNVCAFLDTIALSEIGLDMLSITDDGYNVLVGSRTNALLLFPLLPDGTPDYRQHPVNYDAALHSTAAGRYQELRGNWVAYQRMLALPDFSPVSQDRLAIQQLREAGVLAPLAVNDFATAVTKAAHLWQSFPGPTAQNTPHSMTQLQAWYVAAGGTVT